MKQKDIDNFVYELISELTDNGYMPFISRSNKSKSVYISCLHIPKQIRVSDHGFRYDAYNFTPRRNGNKRSSEGQDFFPMTPNGINLLLEEIKSDFPLVYNAEK